MFAALLKQFQPHMDSVNSIKLFSRAERLLVLTASSDCSVALWDIEGRHIGVFGQVSQTQSLARHSAATSQEHKSGALLVKWDVMLRPV